jgi:hypothetical protein
VQGETSSLCSNFLSRLCFPMPSLSFGGSCLSIIWWFHSSRIVTSKIAFTLTRHFHQPIKRSPIRGSSSIALTTYRPCGQSSRESPCSGLILKEQGKAVFVSSELETTWLPWTGLAGQNKVVHIHLSILCPTLEEESQSMSS